MKESSKRRRHGLRENGSPLTGLVGEHSVDSVDGYSMTSSSGYGMGVPSCSGLSVGEVFVVADGVESRPRFEEIEVEIEGYQAGFEVIEAEKPRTEGAKTETEEDRVELEEVEVEDRAVVEAIAYMRVGTKHNSRL
ncbi:Fc.00g083960.m01.CDS01 [Cosmosporella sp. VM-42]